jgi:NAD+--dinitrogen-reductase ADP-D-ribosyltransferase
VLVERTDRTHVVVRLNNLVSFTSERELAESFGDIILEVEAPTVKILFFNSLLPRHALKGEGEFVVIGGDYQAKALYY